MVTQNKLYENIFIATRKIQEDFPELAKYIDEIPDHFHSDPDKGVNKQELKDYLESLKDIADNYAKEHDNTDNINSKT